MFDNHHINKKIISCIGIVGYLEEDIKKRGLNTNENLPLYCLYAYPNKESVELDSVTYQMMFPDNNHQIPCPKFFTLSLINKKINTYLYCLKFNEKYPFTNDKEEINEIDIPIVIFIKSEKQDLEAFKELLNLINFIIVNDDLEKQGYLNYNNINDFKKVQLMNLFYFIISLPHSSPHSQVKLKLDKEIKNSPFESIDFYFSSNCEIPCNKNDTDINILFLILDQSIIIKVLFAILTEKQIVFRASQAYLLHLLIPTFLKLIFPFKWMFNCVTVLPKEKLSLLDTPESFIFGILSDIMPLKELINKYPGKIIVDCDINEIFGDNYFEPFQPPKNNLFAVHQDEKDKRKKEKKKSIINMGNNLTQGINLVTVGGSYLYKYENDPNNTKKTKLNFEEKNNIIIDMQNSQLLIDKTNSIVDSKELKWLRRNIQLARNPEIFDLENINNKKNSFNQVFLNEDEEENIILPNRAFSYNIQNILMKFFLNKISNTESEFMSIFKNTTLFLEYNDPKKYQNNSGKKIIENILELKQHKRTLDNCFNIEYTLPKFHTQIMLNKIDEKLTENNEKNIDENIKNIYDKIKTILNNYNQMDNEEESENLNNYDGICESERNERKYSLGIKDIVEGRKTEMKKPFGRLTKNFSKHERNKTSVLQETFSGDNKFILNGVDNSVKGVFKFYKDNGFLEFINIFEKFLKEEKIDIKEELYLQKINEQIKDIILENEDFFNNNIIKNNKTKNNNSKRKDTLTEKEKKKKVQMSIIPEFDREEEVDDVGFDGRGTVVQKNVSGDYDFATNFMNKISGLHLNLEGINENKENEMNKYIIIDEDIISFPNLNDKNSEINDNHNNINTEEEQINHKLQYYLFIALILEDILPDKKKSEELFEEINNNENIKINIKQLLLKLYRLSYKYSGLKHRDFPYFSYYNFLISLNLEQLISLKEEFNDFTIDEVELYEILANAIVEKEKVLQKKENNKIMNEDKKVSNSKEKKNNNENKRKRGSFFQVLNRIGEKVHLTKKDILENENYNTDNTYDNNTNIKKNNERLQSLDIIGIGINNLSSQVINMTPEFECEKGDYDYNIIKKIAKEISNLLPKKKENNKTNTNSILIETHCKLIENKKLINLIGQLKYIDVEKMYSLKERMCFWLNCYNYLILFTIFYKKMNLNSRNDWNSFFKTMKYDIGGNNYSFQDMQYTIYKKILFFPRIYEINDNLKKFRVHKAEDAKVLEKKYPLLYNPFQIYMPLKGFIKPIIFDENQLENQFKQRIKEYFNKFIEINKNIIFLPELLIEFYHDFIFKDYKKFQSLINPELYTFIKEGKYKSFSSRNIEWILNFDNLIE